MSRGKTGSVYPSSRNQRYFELSCGAARPGRREAGFGSIGSSPRPPGATAGLPAVQREAFEFDDLNGGTFGRCVDLERLTGGLLRRRD
jgi:hypothetical protein